MSKEELLACPNETKGGNARKRWLHSCEGGDLAPSELVNTFLFLYNKVKIWRP